MPAWPALTVKMRAAQTASQSAATSTRTLQSPERLDVLISSYMPAMSSRATRAAMPPNSRWSLEQTQTRGADWRLAPCAAGLVGRLLATLYLGQQAGAVQRVQWLWQS